MIEFIKYIKLIVAKYFFGPMGWVLNAISLFSLFVSIKLPVFPIWIGFVIFFINTLIITFLVWREELRRAVKSETELQKIRNAIPKYSISIGDIKKYTIQGLIDINSSKTTDLQQQIERINNPPIDSLNLSGGFLAGAQAFSQLTNRLMPAMRSLGYETNDDQLARLKKYNTELLGHENKLKNLYLINLSVNSTMYDKNVEIEISSSDTYEMIVDDNYETDDLPVVEKADGLWLASARHIPYVAMNKYYLQSCVKDNKAFSELAYINASKPTIIFDSSYYVYSKKDKITLQIKIHSTKLIKPQEMDIAIDLSNIPIIQVDNI